MTVNWADIIKTQLFKKGAGCNHTFKMLFSTAGQLMQPAPHQGDQTEAILSGLGYSPERIAELRSQFVV